MAEMPDAFDAAAVEAYLNDRVSAANVRSSMRVILRLITGMGVTHKNKPGEAFLLGHRVTPHDDLEALRAQAADFLPYRKSDPHCKDASHGWALNHPLQKLIEYKNHRLLGIPEKAAKRKRDDPIHMLEKLKGLLDNGTLTQTEFDAKKAEVLARV